MRKSEIALRLIEAMLKRPEISPDLWLNNIRDNGEFFLLVEKIHKLDPPDRSGMPM